MNLLRASGDASNHTSDAVLKHTVLGGVDERVDAAVGEQRYHTQLIEPVRK